MGFWGSMFSGSNPNLSTAIGKAGQTSDYATGQGENLLTGASNFIQGLMSGDPSKTAKLLAPQIQTIQQQAQQAKQGLSQFGNRSGGTNAKAQTIDDTSRATINNMISTLTGTAIGQAGSMGQGLLDTGLNALNMKVNFSQEQMQNWSNSLFGSAIGAGAGMGIGKLATLFGA